MIRKASEEDAVAIVEIASTAPWDKAAYLRRQISAGHVVVACEGEAAVGFIAWNREFFSLPFVWLVVVAPSRRRQGIASRLFAYVEAACSGERLFSSTNKSNAAMQRFLERRSYRPAGEVAVDDGDPELFYELSR